MSFKATLKLGGTEYDVIACNYALHRDVDVKGRPASVNYGGTINLSIESTDDTSIIETMVNNPHKTVDGSITWKKTDEDAKLKELQFEKAYIVSYAETFSTGGGEAMMATFTLSAQKLKIGSAEHVNDWPGAK